MDTEKRLTCTNAIGTILQVEDRSDVDSTARKLFDRMQELERQRSVIDHELRSIRVALSVAGIRSNRLRTGMDTHESLYMTHKPFAGMSLRESCLKILKDQRTEWLSKSQIEYLILRGGYRFATKDSKNSVGVTLQRMTDDGLCEVERMRGSHGNRYRFISEQERSKDAASTTDKRK
jgi:hypothetical protein